METLIAINTIDARIVPFFFLAHIPCLASDGNPWLQSLAAF
jgi:hypothetical protein